MTSTRSGRPPFSVAAGAAVAALAVAGPARAEAPKDLQPEVRVQRRFVEKRHRLALYVGFAYDGRADYYRSPGIEAAVSFYVAESLALDVRGAWFFASPTDELKDIERATGYVPDSHPPRAALLAGVRWSIGYAKIRLPFDYVLHFEPQAFLYGGIHVTAGDAAGTLVAPLAEIGLGLLLHPTPHIQARLDAGVTVGGEQRTSYVAVVGGYPVLAVGVMF